MATDIYTGIGYTVAVAEGEPATFDSVGYEAVGMVYDLVDGVTSIDGSIGSTFSIQTAALLVDGVQKSAKGIQTFETLTTMILDGVTSTGRTTLETAAASLRGQVSLKLTDADGHKAYLTGIVTGNTKPIGNADNVIIKPLPFTPNYAPVYVAAV